MNCGSTADTAASFRLEANCIRSCLRFWAAPGKAIVGKTLDCLATKFAFHFGGPDGFGILGSKEHVRSAVEGSLKRLNVKQIDLYYQHRVDRTIPIEETWQALKVQMPSSQRLIAHQLSRRTLLPVRLPDASPCCRTRF